MSFFSKVSSKVKGKINDVIGDKAFNASSSLLKSIGNNSQIKPLGDIVKNGKTDYYKDLVNSYGISAVLDMANKGTLGSMQIGSDDFKALQQAIQENSDAANKANKEASQISSQRDNVRSLLKEGQVEAKSGDKVSAYLNNKKDKNTLGKEAKTLGSETNTLGVKANQKKQSLLGGK